MSYLIGFIIGLVVGACIPLGIRLYTTKVEGRDSTSNPPTKP